MRGFATSKSSTLSPDLQRAAERDFWGQHLPSLKTAVSMYRQGPGPLTSQRSPVGTRCAMVQSRVVVARGLRSQERANQRQPSGDRQHEAAPGVVIGGVSCGGTSQNERSKGVGGHALVVDRTGDIARGHNEQNARQDQEVASSTHPLPPACGLRAAASRDRLARAITSSASRTQRSRT